MKLGKRPQALGLNLRCQRIPVDVLLRHLRPTSTRVRGLISHVLIPFAGTCISQCQHQQFKTRYRTFGIDGAAHRATLAADGATVAVLAGGIDVLYPAGHSALLHRIAGAGLLVTEYPPGVRPARHRFLTRNRLVAALSSATVVVEAGIRSGAANTAAWARSLGRVVCAVPGPVTSLASVGCHVLLRQGAQLVTRADEVRELVGRMGELADEPTRPNTALDDLDDTERQVYEALPARGARTADEIAVNSGLPVGAVLGSLAMLEIAGLAQRHEGRWRLVRRPGSVA